MIPALAELGIAMTAYGVLSRGLLTASKPAGAGDLRAHLPRFAGANGEKNQRAGRGARPLAAARGVTPAQLAIAWVARRARRRASPSIPTMGARTRAQLADALAGLELALTAEEVAALEAAVPAAEVAGTRYPAAAMARLDSER